MYNHNREAFYWETTISENPSVPSLYRQIFQISAIGVPVKIKFSKVTKRRIYEVFCRNL